MNAARPTGWRCARCSAASARRALPAQSARVTSLAVSQRYRSDLSEAVLKRRSTSQESSLSPPFRRFDVLKGKSDMSPKTLREMAQRALDSMQQNLGYPMFCRTLGTDPSEAPAEFAEFRKALEDRMKKWPKDPSQDEIYKRMRDARAISMKNFTQTIRYWVQHHFASKRLAGRPLVQQRLKELADLRRPFEWFPVARRVKRKFHLHIGPTNSGKTYHALKRLEEAESGLYAGPLRLLAREVYQRLNAAGKPCRLKTGDEQLEPPGAMPEDKVNMVSCTVEMTPLETSFDVAVIDEIQMIADSERGSAWTLALLGVAAREIHVCGEERSHDLIRNIAHAFGDEFEVHRYERLSPLKVQGRSLDGSWNHLRKGDCVVGFSVETLHALRSLIERKTRKKVAIVYGSLPPEIRTQQAALFNDPDSGYDILVASDAIGMGLNLNIQRIIFYTTTKRTPKGVGAIDTSSIKQIAGRAGRFKVAPKLTTFSEADPDPSSGVEVIQKPLPETATKAPLLGLVTTLNKDDLSLVQSAMSGKVQPLTHASITPTDVNFLQFSSLFPRGTPFSYMLLRFYTTAQLHPMFKMELKNESLMIADLIEAVPNMSNQDRLVFTHAPISRRETGVQKFALKLASHVGESRPGPILEIPGLDIELLDRQGPATLEYLRDLENMHKCLVLYNWLSFRFESIFEARATATHLKTILENRIAQSLFELSSDFQLKLQRDAVRAKKKVQRQSEWEREQREGWQRKWFEKQPSTETTAKVGDAPPHESPIIEVDGKILPNSDGPMSKRSDRMFDSDTLKGSETASASH